MPADEPRWGFPVADWHEWFAWLPVRTFDGRWSWLIWVNRRLVQKYSYLDGGSAQWWQYRRREGA